MQLTGIICLDKTLNSLPNTEKGKSLGSKSTDIHPLKDMFERTRDPAKIKVYL